MSSPAPHPAPPPMRTKRLPPKLPRSAFLPPTAAPTQPKRLHPLTLIDTHIHLWTQEQLDNGNASWQPTAQFSQLKEEHSWSDYCRVVRGGVEHLGAGRGAGERQTEFHGAVFVQAEATHDDEDEDGSQGGWDGAIEEIDHVCKAALASSEQIKLLALVPWAPVHQGPSALATYFTRLRSVPSLIALTAQSTSANSPLGLLKSCRYLLQDSPRGFFLSDQFIAGLKWLGQQGIGFDFTVDTVQQEGVLEDVIDAIARVREGQSHDDESKQTKFIIDHFAKPPLIPEPTIPASPLQSSYITSLFSLSLLSNVTLKLSGLLDSAAPELVARAFAEYSEEQQGVAAEEEEGESKTDGPEMEELRRRVLTFLEPALESFGEGRIMIGSDWPMFRAKTLPPTPPSASRDRKAEALAWAFEMDLYRTAAVQLGLEGEALDRLFAGNAREVYGL